MTHIRPFRGHRKGHSTKGCVTKMACTRCAAFGSCRRVRLASPVV